MHILYFPLDAKTCKNLEKLITEKARMYVGIYGWFVRSGYTQGQRRRTDGRMK